MIPSEGYGTTPCSHRSLGVAREGGEIPLAPTAVGIGAPNGPLCHRN
jgi:hypothetical protein